MVGLTEKLDGNGRQLTRRPSALSGFSYENGYMLLATDLGNQGVKIELAHDRQDSGAIILPPAKAKECARWMLRTIAHRNYSPLRELPDILNRLVKQKTSGRVLQRGDKKKIKEAVKLLKSQSP